MPVFRLCGQIVGRVIDATYNHIISQKSSFELEQMQLLLTCYPLKQREKESPNNMGIYDASDFTLLCSESNRCGERWAGGHFLSMDRVIVWNTDGRGYLYKLPTNLLRGKAVQSANPESSDYHRSHHQATVHAYYILDVYSNQGPVCPPAMTFFRGGKENKRSLLLRGDSEGRVVVWQVPEVSEKQMTLVRQESFDRLPALMPKLCTTLQDLWSSHRHYSPGILDGLCDEDGPLKITATIYIPSQGKLVCGRENGTIAIVPAIQCLMMQLLSTKTNHEDIPLKMLEGHDGRVTCLLYPFNECTRYEPHHLLSGGIDFSVILWDIESGCRIHTFTVHGGMLEQLIVPPANCNPRILSSVCSVASDHSVALLSLKERKCIMLAGRHMFPVKTIRWRPLDDFMVVSCTNGAVHVWQMETGHLDRVVNGITAEEILNNCDENALPTESLTNPSLTLAQALKRRNLATFRNLAQQKLQQSAVNQANMQGPKVEFIKPTGFPLLLQGVRTNTKDPDAHVLFFDTEALIVQLLTEEYALLSPGELEARGLTVLSSDKLPQGHGEASDAQQKLAGFLAKAKEKAENVSQRIQAKMDQTGDTVSSQTQYHGVTSDGNLPKPSPAHPDGGIASAAARPDHISVPESMTMEIAQLFMSCLHAWGLDPDLDRLCINKLGLLKPRCPMSFGLLSRQGHMSLMLPAAGSIGPDQTVLSRSGVIRGDPKKHKPTLLAQRMGSVPFDDVTYRFHASQVQSHHGIIMHDTGEAGDTGSEDDAAEAAMLVQGQVKQGWSLLAALHCVLLPELIGADHYRSPQLEMLARRWQDRCLEIREAAQALLLAELRRIGPEGRKVVIDEWSPYLPTYVDPSLSDMPAKASASFESRRKQAAAIVMLGVIGAEFGQEIEPSRRRVDDSKKVKVRSQEGFSLSNYSLSRHTSKALTFLLLTPPSVKLPAFTPIRRAAMDLLGRGFTVWEPYLDISAVLMGLLELCIDAEKRVPSMTYGLPLSPAADACRTARHALSLIATARPPAFIITLAKEVARYNAMAQNAQSQHTQMHNSVLVRAAPEILHVIETLVDKMPNDVADLIIEVMDVTMHCLDLNQLKSRGLQDLFPAICRFSMVSYCAHTKRIWVGSKNGGLALYEMKQHAKCQMIQAHHGPVIAVAVSPDGKFLATFSHRDQKLKFFQTASSSIFGIGSQQTKCVRQFTTKEIIVTPLTNILKLVRLVWIDNRTVVLLTVDGSETKYSI
ncbi:hypothetical protein BaRGS_00033924 [Batillaria attramentaria]|uniref:WD repeat-containing protein 7 n=1 Tax=Batillaria attramentaria TaxID=370345 RepID=A0ABD0JIR4_9CAEN